MIRNILKNSNKISFLKNVPRFNYGILNEEIKFTDNCVYVKMI